jgi:tRNA (cytidine32/uridine32-2'-O)-methyltransferase
MQSIRIVLVNPSHPGNIGATARAMKTMGLSNLYLVQPKAFPDQQASVMASHAADVLENAVVVSELQEAIADCQLILATSARDRDKPWPMLSPRDMAETISKEADDAQIAILFGRESVGLSNEELQLAHFHIQIPSIEEYSSLNLAQAVQVICYECRLASLEDAPKKEITTQHATAEEMEGLHQQLEERLIHSGFINPEKPMLTMVKLRKIFNKARLEDREVSLLRGVVKALTS